MSKVIVIIVLSLSMFNNIFAQNNSTNNASNVANKIAKKMQDSLSLNAQQKIEIYNVNINIHNKKQTARTEVVNNIPLLTQKIQTIEATRDSLYQPILTLNQFNLYKQKKRVLISNN